MILSTTKRTVEVSEDLRVDRDSNGHIRVWLGRDVIASEDNLERAARWALTIHENPGNVAMLGLGTGNLLRLLPGVPATVYEYYQPLIDWFQAEFPWACKNVTFVPGDCRETLSGTYRYIVEDTGLAIPDPELATHLKDGGLILR